MGEVNDTKEQYAQRDGQNGIAIYMLHALRDFSGEGIKRFSASDTSVHSDAFSADTSYTLCSISSVRSRFPTKENISDATFAGRTPVSIPPRRCVFAEALCALEKGFTCSDLSEPVVGYRVVVQRSVKVMLPFRLCSSFRARRWKMRPPVSFRQTRCM